MKSLINQIIHSIESITNWLDKLKKEYQGLKIKLRNYCI
jgi:hypothetical protein